MQAHIPHVAHDQARDVLQMLDHVVDREAEQALVPWMGLKRPQPSLASVAFEAKGCPSRWAHGRLEKPSA